MAQKMATVERVEELLEKLRAASWDHAVKGTTNQITILLPIGFFLLHSHKVVCFLAFLLLRHLRYVICIKLFSLMIFSIDQIYQVCI
jgi:hypothetical protein